MAQVVPNKVGRARKRNERYWEVASFSKHWPCLFPQHGPGRKHERKIELTPGSRNWSTSTRGRWSGGCCTRTGAGC